MLKNELGKYFPRSLPALGERIGRSGGLIRFDQTWEPYYVSFERVQQTLPRLRGGRFNRAVAVALEPTFRRLGLVKPRSRRRARANWRVVRRVAAQVEWRTVVYLTLLLALFLISQALVSLFGA